MPKRRELTFDECLSLMRGRDPQLMEEGFHALQPRAREHLPRLLEAFQAEAEPGLRRWLLELITDARSEDAFPALCEQAMSSDESLRPWAIRGLELLDTKASRTFLFEYGLSRQRAGDWRSATLARIRTLITQTDPDIVEEIKWRKPSNPAGVPVWSLPASSGGGMICTGETYKDKVKLTFAKGAALEDPSGLFNASLDGATRRAIDIRERDTINEKAFKALIREAIALDAPGPAATPRSRKGPKRT